MNIICLATRRIDDDLPTNVQHLMLKLASKHTILYVEPPVDGIFLSRNPGFSNRLPRLKDKYPSSLHPVYPEIFPYERFFPFLLKFLNTCRTANYIKRAAAKRKIKPDVVWLFRPQDYRIAKKIKARHLCYHITDKYNAMPVNAGNKRDSDRLDQLENKIIDQADLVFCTAKSLWREASYKSENAIYVGNVADVKHFKIANDPSTTIPDDIVNLPKPVIGFIGAISDLKIDFALIRATAQTFQDASIVMIGPHRNDESAVRNSLPQNRNIHYLGKKDYNSLPGYLRGIDVCMIPFMKSRYTDHVFPLKFFEYLAAGKPVVSTPLPSIQDFQHLFYSAAKPTEWVDAMRAACVEIDEAIKEERKAAALKNSWERRIPEIEYYLSAL